MRPRDLAIEQRVREVAERIGGTYAFRMGCYVITTKIGLGCGISIDKAQDPENLELYLSWFDANTLSHRSETP